MPSTLIVFFLQFKIQQYQKRGRHRVCIASFSKGLNPAKQINTVRRLDLTEDESLVKTPFCYSK
jgi:hypothetical protein